jgi:hypothetical protein
VEILKTEFSDISSGILIYGGKVEIDGKTYELFDLSCRSSGNYKSARKNVHCEGEAEMKIRSTSFTEESSLWIDNVDCEISVENKNEDEINLPSLLFIPKVDWISSVDILDENGMKRTVVEIKGKKLIECDILFEGYMKDGSDNVDNNSEVLELYENSTEEYVYGMWPFEIDDAVDESENSRYKNWIIRFFIYLFKSYLFKSTF